MNHYPPSIHNAIKHLARLPGIGAKTAERLSLHLLQRPLAEVEELSRSLIALKKQTTLCSQCLTLCDGATCRICSDPTRTPTLVCVVENPADMMSIERTGVFSGRYHVLHGALSPMDGIGPEELRIRELFQRIKRDNVKEVVLATSTQVEGESTAAYLADQLRAYNIRITRIASGMPIGGDLKYVDQVTLKNAMEKRYNL